MTLTVALLLATFATTDSFRCQLIRAPKRYTPVASIRLDETVLKSVQKDATAAAWNNAPMSRPEAQHMMETRLLPEKDYGERIEYGRDAQGIPQSSIVVPDDPRMYLTYGEFPLESFDALLDLALPRVMLNNAASVEMVDLGSGCGRLVLYAALTRGSEEQPWHIHGIEISSLLHSLAVDAMDKGVTAGWLSNNNDSSSVCTLELHEGPAQEWTSVMSKCNLVFAYSTVWETRGFSPELGAMIIGQDWSALLAESCPNGCVAITTDRALDPNNGWELVDRLDVDNREVMGSTGYVHVLRK